MMKEHENMKRFRTFRPLARKRLWCLFACHMLLFSNFTFSQETMDTDKEKTKELDLSFQKINWDEFNGSAYRVSGDQIRNLPISNLGNALAGLVPGFYSRQKSGGILNEAPNYWIRGLRTGTNSEGVLVLVDGQEREFGSLSPYEIEEVIVLKDAAATALYGMRGSNGAILVNTRKGVIGKPQIELTAQVINQQPLKQLDRLNALGYATHYNKAMLNKGGEPLYTDYYLSRYRNGTNNELYPDVNWLDNLMKSCSWMQRYNLNLYGGSAKVRYFINAGLLTQDGFYKTGDEYDYSTNNGIDRFNVRSNVEFDVTSTTLFSLDLYGLDEKQNRPGNNSAAVYQALLSTPPNLFPEYYVDNGKYVDQSGDRVSSYNGKIVAGDGRINPWALLNRAGYGTFHSTYGSFRAKVSQNLNMITKGLSASVTFSMDSYTQAVTNRSKGYASYLLNPESNTPNVLMKTGEDTKMQNTIGTKDSYRRTTIEAQLSYVRSFGEHKLSALAFYNQYESSNEVSIPKRFQSANAWLGYNYDQRYGIDLLMSYSGAYLFKKGDRFGFFPTIAAGWTLSNESFFEGIKEWIPYLKLKGSFGKTGNYRGIAEHAYIGSLENVPGSYPFGNSMAGSPGYREGIIADPNATWEKVQQGNIGLEAGLFNNRFNITAEYFHDKRTDIYMTNNRLSFLYGYDVGISENLGKTHSQGVELTARWNDKIGDWGYTVGGTFSYANNLLEEDGQAEQPYPWMRNAGYSIGTKRGYIAEGFFSSYEEIAAAPYHTFGTVHPGDIRYKDINGDGVINSEDQVPIGYADVPKLYYSANIGFSYKGFSLSAVFTGAGKFSRNINGGRVAYPFYNNGTIYAHQTDYWTPENPTAKYPRISLDNTTGTNNTMDNTIWIKNIRYLRLNTIQLEYKFPEKMFAKSFVKGLQVFANAYNVCTWSNMEVIDPEVDENGNSVPLTRNINLGLSIKF